MRRNCLAEEVHSNNDFGLPQNARIQHNTKEEQQDNMTRYLGMNLFRLVVLFFNKEELEAAKRKLSKSSFAV